MSDEEDSGETDSGKEKSQDSAEAFEDEIKNDGSFARTDNKVL